MLRSLFALAVLLTPLPAAAQPAGVSTDAAAAIRALSAMWRPMAGAQSVEAACQGALEEMDAVDAALPPVLTQESLARVRALRGLLVVPTEDAGAAYFFPDRSMDWFTPGLATVETPAGQAEGFVHIRDAAGRDIAAQLGAGGGHPVLRIRAPEGQILNFVGCASTRGS